MRFELIPQQMGCLLLHDVLSLLPQEEQDCVEADVVQVVLQLIVSENVAVGCDEDIRAVLHKDQSQSVPLKPHLTYMVVVSVRAGAGFSMYRAAESSIAWPILPVNMADAESLVLPIPTSLEGVLKRPILNPTLIPNWEARVLPNGLADPKVFEDHIRNFMGDIEVRATDNQGDALSLPYNAVLDGCDGRRLALLDQCIPKGNPLLQVLDCMPMFEDDIHKELKEVIGFGNVETKMGILYTDKSFFTALHVDHMCTMGWMLLVEGRKTFNFWDGNDQMVMAAWESCLNAGQSGGAVIGAQNVRYRSSTSDWDVGNPPTEEKHPGDGKGQNGGAVSGSQNVVYGSSMSGWDVGNPPTEEKHPGDGKGQSGGAVSGAQNVRYGSSTSGWDVGNPPTDEKHLGDGKGG
ncbi:hypothetical protein L7F22_057355 [Adiantum nelumboides]|nr:hypothetical protein [Adiantum nelumboides]